MAGTIQFEVKLTGLDGVINMFDQLPAELISKRGGPVKRALKKAAVVVLKQAQINLRASIQRGKVPEESTGLLEKSLIVSRGKAPQGGNGERYLLRVKRKAYDGAKLGKKESPGKRVTTLQTANLLEYGAPGNDQEAQPWLRPAAASKAAEAISTFEAAIVADVNKIATKLARQGGTP